MKKLCHFLIVVSFSPSFPKLSCPPLLAASTAPRLSLPTPSSRLPPRVIPSPSLSLSCSPAASSPPPPPSSPSSPSSPTGSDDQRLEETPSTTDHWMLGEGQFRRARKALIDLFVSMLDEKDSSSSSASSIAAHRNRSFGHQNPSKDHHHLAGHFWSLSWSVSCSWSASRQL
ncbi:hypothetical protein Tsubulata_021005 [Turnera subulata]|uniref:Uncharacterized protein n=1 Tax=Turnera subulata TaxID=218843 RepID=A0A9Q0FPT5_9ROSI|nr:hypothetical protein Tsubulata_021005 [Turnera subulata]